ncbi:MAG: hypothetical protein AAGU74_05510 [Bacillota bacterium]
MKDKGKKRRISDYWNIGTAIGLCAAVGVVLGALLNDIGFYLGAGAGVGVVLGAATHLYRMKR